MRLAYVLLRNVYLPEAEDAIGVLPARALGAVPLAYLAEYLGLRLWRVSQLLRRQDISYGVHVWHMMIVGLGLYLAAQTGVEVLSNPYLLVAATVGISFASWTLVERRALRLKPFTSRPSDQPGTSRANTRIPYATAPSLVEPATRNATEPT